MPAYDFRVEDVWDNGEFLTGATLVLLEDGQEVSRETFTASSEFENDGPAHVLATSAAVAWLEAMELDPLARYGLEWEREQDERMGVA